MGNARGAFEMKCLIYGINYRLYNDHELQQFDD